MAHGLWSRLRGLSVTVGVKEKGTISKGKGRCPASSFATVEKELQVAFRI